MKKLGLKIVGGLGILVAAYFIILLVTAWI